MNRRAMLRAGAVTVVGAGAGWLLTACSDSPAKSKGSGGTEKIRFQLDFTPLGRFAPFYFGVESGIYSDLGLNVSISTASGSGPALQQLAAGNVDVGMNDLGQMLNYQGKNPGKRMRSYAVIFAKASQTIFFYEDGPIKTPKDLEGKKIATSAGSNEFLLFPVFAKANDVDESEVKWETVDPTAKVGLLLQDKVDATSTTVFGLAALEQGVKDGRKIGYFTYGDYGVRTHGASLIATDDFADKHRDALYKFVRGTIEAHRKTFEDNDAAIKAMLKQVPLLKEPVAKRELELLPSIAEGPYQKENGLGMQDPELVQSTYDLVGTVLKQSIPNPYTDYFTNDALQQK